MIKIKKHEKEVLQAQLDNEKAVLKELEEVYKKALEDIDEKIAALLGRSDADLSHVIYQVEYQRQLRTQIQAALEQLQANEFATISSYLTDCYEDGFMSALYSMQQQGIPLVFPIDQSQVVAAIQTDSKISEGLYTRLGKDIGELKKTISSELARGIATSMPYSQIAKNLNRAADIGLHRAMRITRTEGGRIQNKAAMDAMYKAKDNGADIMKRWSAALDARTRESHVKVDGEIREIDKPFSNKLQYPKDPSGKASEVVNCRCRVQQKARWALEADETKMLGDVSQMSEAQRKAIAKKLGIPEKDLDKYSKQIVPVNAKSYSDFKKKYNELWHYEGSDLQKEAEARIASYKNKSSKKVLENSVNKSILNSRADPMADAFGAGVTSNPKEVEAYKKELGQLGVKLVERESESLGYSPGLMSGVPGTVYISTGASYSAWSHEMQHVHDDQSAGWLGMRVIADPDLRYEWEVRAYNIEIEMAKEAGRLDIVKLLEENLEKERKAIYGE